MGKIGASGDVGLITSILWKMLFLVKIGFDVLSIKNEKQNKNIYPAQRTVEPMEAMYFTWVIF